MIAIVTSYPYYCHLFSITMLMSCQYALYAIICQYYDFYNYGVPLFLRLIFITIIMTYHYVSHAIIRQHHGCYYSRLPLPLLLLFVFIIIVVVYQPAFYDIYANIMIVIIVDYRYYSWSFGTIVMMHHDVSYVTMCQHYDCYSCNLPLLLLFAFHHCYHEVSLCIIWHYMSAVWLLLLHITIIIHKMVIIIIIIIRSYRYCHGAPLRNICHRVPILWLWLLLVTILIIVIIICSVDVIMAFRYTLYVAICQHYDCYCCRSTLLCAF